MPDGSVALVPVLVAGVGDWLAAARNDERAEYLLKPLTLGLLIVAAAIMGVHWPVLAALAFSLAGDVFLMLPEDRFVPGLVSFLLAHVFYVVAYFQLDASFVVRSIVLLGIVVAGSFLLPRIRGGLIAKGLERLQVPVIAYVLVISAMVFTVVSTAPELPSPQQWFAAGGALLFYASDALIGWTRFVDPLRGGRVAIMITYHLGQIGLVVGAVD